MITDEAHRLKALHHYRILDTDPEQAFDDLALLAYGHCRVQRSGSTSRDAKAAARERVAEEGARRQANRELIGALGEFPVPLEETLPIARQVAGALENVTSKGRTPA